MLLSKIEKTENIIREISKKNNEPEWLLNNRLASFKTFKETKMPDFIYGLNINLNIDLNLDELKLENSGSPNTIIKNNNNELIIKDFNTLANTTTLKNYFMTLVPPNDKFTSFHQSFLNNLTCIIVPKNYQSSEPVELISNMNSEILFDHLIILLEDNSALTLVENSISENNSINNHSNQQLTDFKSKIVEIFIGDNAILNYGNVQLLNSSTINFTIKKAVVGKNSTINWMDCCFGSKSTISDITTILSGRGSQTNNYGIFFGAKNQQFDIVANSIHQAPETISDIFTKGTLTQNSKCVYRGLVKIHENAFRSNGYQKEDTLLLSSDACADSIPNLEIDNNDVRCTHGATIGRIDKEKLFYMQSRGLDNEQSTREYVKGFFEPLIQKIQIKHLRDNMHDMIEQRMK